MNHVEFRTRIMQVGQSIKSCMSKVIEPVLATEELTALQAMILFSIKTNMVNNLSSLNKELGVGQANASTICKKMEKSGFISRVRASDDERVVNIYLTEKAELALCNLEKKSERFDPILQMISKEKFDTIIKGLEAMEEVLQFVIEQNVADSKRG